MRNAILITLIIAVCYPVSAAALTGISIGGKVGHTEYRGDVLPGSGDIGSGIGYALMLNIGTLPAVDFEIRASYFTKDFDYSYDVLGSPVTGSFEYRDAAVTALLKKTLFSLPGFPVSMYACGGVGYHLINTETAVALAEGTVPPGETGDPVGLLKNTGKIGGEGAAGVKVSPGPIPLVFFGEARYGVIFASERLTQVEFAGGLMIRF